ncbi:MAG: flippase [Candidatus Limivicinus sp.]|jgi:O-antigen/teichoic acid export membrane protein
MVKQISIKKNFIMNTLLTMSSFIFPLITFPYISRILRPEYTGKVAFATSVISYFNLIAQLGIPTYGIRSCAMVRNDKEKLSRTTHELLAINLITTIISYIALAVTITLSPKLQQEKTLLIIISSSIFLNAIGMEWLYRGLEQYTYITIRSVTFKGIAMCFMLLLVHAQEDYLIYGGITIIASSASYIMNFLNAKKYIYLHPVGRYNLKQHIKPILVFFALACATTVYTNLDNVMLGFMQSDSAVGCYHVAIRIRSILLGVVTSLGAVLLPRSSYYIEHNLMEEFKRATQNAIHFVLLLATPLTLFFILYASYSVYFIAGPSYKQSILAMQIVMPTLILVGITNIFGFQVLVPTGREVLVLKSVIVGAIVDLIVNLLLIPRFSLIGAAIGTLAAEILVLLVQAYYLKDMLKEYFQDVSVFKLVFALFIASCISLLSIQSLKSDFLILLTGGITFFGTYISILLITREKMVLKYIILFGKKIIAFLKR